MMRSRKAVQRSTWRSWKPSGRPRSCEALGLPVDLRQQGDALDQLVGQARPGPRGRCRTARASCSVERPRAHRRPAVDEAHQVEGPAEHRGVGADGDGLGVGHVGAVERLDDAPLAEDARRPGSRAPSAAGCAGRRGARRGGSRRSRSGCRRRRSGTRWARRCRRAGPWLVEPGAASRSSVDHHRFPTSCSRYSANFARAAASFFGPVLGGPEVVARPVVAQHLAGDGDLVDLGRPVGQAHDRRRPAASR